MHEVQRIFLRISQERDYRCEMVIESLNLKISTRRRKYCTEIQHKFKLQSVINCNIGYLCMKSGAIFREYQNNLIVKVRR